MVKIKRPIYNNTFFRLFWQKNRVIKEGLCFFGKSAKINPFLNGST
jgi:hypothetical protein